jgi:hypothetical protein
MECFWCNKVIKFVDEASASLILSFKDGSQAETCSKSCFDAIVKVYVNDKKYIDGDTMDWGSK